MSETMSATDGTGEHSCAWCGLTTEFEAYGSDDFYKWLRLPPLWLVSPGRDHDSAEIYVCSKDHADAYDQAARLWKEYKKRGGYYLSARWRHITAAAKMTAEFGADWVARLLPDDRETFAARERDDHWTNSPERPKRGAVVHQFPDGPHRRDVCFCEWCLVEWIGRHDCPQSGLCCAIQVSMGPIPELQAVPIESSRYAAMLAGEA
jgi:hypothetical protein